MKKQTLIFDVIITLKIYKIIQVKFLIQLLYYM